jgi:hypothetical protein
MRADEHPQFEWLKQVYDDLNSHDIIYVLESQFGYLKLATPDCITIVTGSNPVSQSQPGLKRRLAGVLRALLGHQHYSV